MRKMRRFVEILVATLREIFDESAYARFLGRNGLNSTPESYAAFLREHDLAAARRPRCC
jgi:hypothetical protein